MNRSAVLMLAAVALGAYAIYTALHVPGMLVGPPVPLLLIAFLAQVVSAIIAAVGLATGQRWGGVAVVIFAVCIAGTQLIEVLLGVAPYLRAVFISVVAIVGALLFAAYARRSPGSAAAVPLTTR